MGPEAAQGQERGVRAAAEVQAQAAVALAQGPVVGEEQERAAVVALAQGPAVGEEQEQAVVALGQAPVVEAELGAAQEGLESAVEGDWELREQKVRRSENGERRPQCCTPVGLEEAAESRESAEELGPAAEHTASRKKMFARCWDCSRNWENQGKIPSTAWTYRRSSRA